MSNVQARIYVATHRPAAFPSDGRYAPIHVGKNLSQQDLQIAGDDSGNSISCLNKSFCELTGIYWIWKNDKSPFVGLCHYRRYFAPRKVPLAFMGVAIASPEDFDELGEGADVIVAEPVGFHLGPGNLPHSVGQKYADSHFIADLFVARKAVAELHPAYLAAFDFVMNSNRLSPYNMFVGRKEVMNGYCDWVFSILFKLERLIPYRFYNAYQERVFGFLAERLFNVWLVENRGTYGVAYRDVITLGE